MLSDPKVKEFSLLFRFQVVLFFSAFGHKEIDDEVNSGYSDDDIDDPRDCASAEDLVDQIKTKCPDQPPVEGSNEDQNLTNPSQKAYFFINSSLMSISLSAYGGFIKLYRIKFFCFASTPFAPVKLKIDAP